MPRLWTTAASGWRSITTCRGDKAPPITVETAHTLHLPKRPSVTSWPVYWLASLRRRRLHGTGERNSVSTLANSRSGLVNRPERKAAYRPGMESRAMGALPCIWWNSSQVLRYEPDRRAQTQRGICHGNNRASSLRSQYTFHSTWRLPSNTRGCAITDSGQRHGARQSKDKRIKAGSCDSGMVTTGSDRPTAHIGANLFSSGCPTSAPDPRRGAYRRSSGGA